MNRLRLTISFLLIVLSMIGIVFLSGTLLMYQ